MPLHGSEYGVAQLAFYPTATPRRTFDIEALVPLTEELQENGLQGFKKLDGDQGMRSGRIGHDRALSARNWRNDTLERE